jgi:hypothetical protein
MRACQRKAWLRYGVLAAFGASAVVAEAASEPGWAVYRDQVPALLYGDPEKALISIICGRDEETSEDETWITVEVEPGVKPAPVNVVLVLENGTARKEVSLQPRACAPNQCTARSEGEVYQYEATFPGLEPALDIAENVTKLSIDAPGAKVSAAADETAFTSFAVLCRNW